MAILIYKLDVSIIFIQISDNAHTQPQRNKYQQPLLLSQVSLFAFCIRFFRKYQNLGLTDVEYFDQWTVALHFLLGEACFLLYFVLLFFLILMQTKVNKECIGSWNFYLVS